VVGVNRYGEIGNEKYLGRSVVVSPSGKIIYECQNKEEIVPVEIDLDEIIAERGKEPTFSEFEIEVYDRFMEHLQEG
jgi:predicted amidohydrolase